MRILLTDPDQRATLATARSLVADGHQVMVAARGRWSLAAVSRGVEPILVEEDPLAAPGPWGEAILALLTTRRIELLLPMTDAAVEALLPLRHRFPASTAFPFPASESWRTATDKDQILALALESGLPIPETIRLATPTAPLTDPSLFPAVLKPHRSVTNGRPDGGATKLTPRPVQDPAECADLLEALPPSAYPVLLQRQVEGPGEGLFLLRWEGRIIASFAHRRLRERPPWGGVSVYRESIPLPADLLQSGIALLERLDWQGVAMIECKKDLGTGRHVLMEINGRLWGSLQLAIDAGVDFPRLLVECVAGHTLPAPPPYAIGVRSRWFWGEVDHLYLRLRHGPARLAAVRDFFANRGPRDAEEIWRWNDPAPFIVESLRWLAAL